MSRFVRPTVCHPGKNSSYFAISRDLLALVHAVERSAGRDRAMGQGDYRDPRIGRVGIDAEIDNRNLAVFAAIKSIQRDVRATPFAIDREQSGTGRRFGRWPRCDLDKSPVVVVGAATRNCQ